MISTAQKIEDIDAFGKAFRILKALNMKVMDVSNHDYYNNIYLYII